MARLVRSGRVPAQYDWLGWWLVGLLGGTHCIGMCGGLVAAFSMGLPARRRMLYWGLLNTGRLLSYMLAGVLAGLLGATLHGYGRLLPLQWLLYMLSQLLLVFLGLHLSGLPTLIPRLEKWGSLLWRHLQPRFRALLPLRTPGQALLAGLFWGWLPCGLVYTALSSALLSGTPVLGAAQMLAFGLGTLPTLLVMGKLAPWLQRPMLRRLSGLLVMVLGGWGIWNGLHLLPSVKAALLL
ncbi:sulfite exporter TauE/SafE family protein [Leeia sp. IMCC25680]|uniref:Sulfite exporter TauE/SafE family protein n=1 Tax=Leeia aquatica TaxID=2725557 RepID=A0A847SEZ7_9NEIS|nr:sulfite exporter TauE/SafE family protein [Leeia aquatica]